MSSDSGKAFVVHQVKADVSIPSSSGHVFGQPAQGHAADPPPCFNPLFIGACLRTSAAPGRCACIVARFNPLFIGACLRTRQGGVEVAGHADEFQSPLHRGMSSDIAKVLVSLTIGGDVSIPSSSGHVFGPKQRVADERDGYQFQSPLHRGMSSDRRAHQADRAGYRTSFNPLFIGACLRTRHVQLSEVAQGEVSIPSSSGHVFGRSLVSLRDTDHGAVSIPSSSGHVFGRHGHGPSQPGQSFNPLFIGACLRTDDELRTVACPCRFQSPLHRGMSSDAAGRLSCQSRTTRFQSPLHRGMSSDAKLLCHG